MAASSPTYQERPSMHTNEKIRQFIAAELLSGVDPTSLGDFDALIESGIIDSFGVMSVIAFIEKEFGIQLKSSDLVPDNFQNVAAISELVKQWLSETESRT